MVIWKIVLPLNMKKPVKANIKFKDYSPGQTMLLPPSLDEMIDANHPVRIVNRVIDQVEIDPLIEKFKGGGTSSYHPRMLLKVIVFAYLSNTYSSRRMEAALKENIYFMWISGMSQPDHNTLNRFRSERLKGVLKQVFGKVVELLVEQGLVTTCSDGYTQIYARYQAINCQGCPLRGMCHDRPENRIIEVNHHLKSLKEKARDLLRSEEGIRYRKTRCADVEPVFDIKCNKGFKRFMLKGCEKVEIEAGLLSIAHNLKKWYC